MANEKKSKGYILGLDIGSSSLGWALIDEKSNRIIKTGSHIFEAGVEGDIESGRDESRNQKRRDARQIRRQIWRTAHRKRKLFKILQENGLLPAGEVSGVIAEIDHKVFSRIEKSDPNRHVLAQVIPYLLRKRAISGKLEKHEIGRVLYHIAQRRGFLSNRKSAPKKDDDSGKVKSGITELGRKIEESGARTLGEYFSSLARYPSPQQVRRVLPCK
jgi:CRISPR-associated endonuclease Csn1